jgi:glutamine cyclotransferase
MTTISKTLLVHQLALILILFTAGAGATELPVYGYKVTDKLAQPRENFVQGLQILDGHIYVSVGNYGQSKLLRYRLGDGELLEGRRVDNRLFAEGLTVLGDRIYQLTWRAGLMLVYNKADLAGIEYFRIPGRGWGLTNNGEKLIYSDGSHRLHYMSATTGQITHSIEVTEDGRPVTRLNELEWINGKVWANIWQTDRIVIIDPESGEVTASVDLSGLLPAPERQPGTDVLNGIAQNPEDGSIWVTGKRWPWLYQIELIRPLPATKQSEAAEPNSR